MTEYNREKRQRQPTHPGEVLREDILPDLGISVTSFSEGIHVSRQTVHKILAEEKGITPAMALKIGKFVGNGPEIWLRMQQNYDLYQAEISLADELEDIRECCG